MHQRTETRTSLSESTGLLRLQPADALATFPRAGRALASFDGSQQRQHFVHSDRLCNPVAQLVLRIELLRLPRKAYVLGGGKVLVSV
jgi:hypothetical protein